MKAVRFCLLILALALSGGSVWAGEIQRLIVFGDSLSDTGNVFQFSGNTRPPSPPYGGLTANDESPFPGRFSNGQV